LRAPELAEAGLQAEARATPVGLYAQVVESGARPHTAADRFARRISDDGSRLARDSVILRRRDSQLREDDPTHERPRRIEFDPLTISVPIAPVAGRGQSAGEQEVGDEINKMRSLIPVYWANYDRGLNNFRDGMSFASDQETQPCYFEVTLKEVGKLVLEAALHWAVDGYPALGEFASDLKAVVEAWHAEAQRAARAQGERRIADYVSDFRNQAGTLQLQMLQVINLARPRLLTEYRDAVARSRVERQGEYGVLTGDAAIFLGQLRKGVQQFEGHVSSPARFAQYFAERFGGSSAWTRRILASDREGGTLYLNAEVYLNTTHGTPQWSLRSIEPAWTLATTAPQPERIATTLKTALRQQGKRAWQTNLPKMLQLRIEEEVPGAFASNRYSTGYIRFTENPDRHEVRTNLNADIFRQAWRVAGIRQRLLEVNELVGSNQ